MTTIYKLTWGAADHIQQQARFFNPSHVADACVRFSERVLEMDRNKDIWAAYASLERLPDRIFPKGLHLIAWTKTSDERPTVEGEKTAEAALEQWPQTANLSHLDLTFIRQAVESYAAQLGADASALLKRIDEQIAKVRC